MILYSSQWFIPFSPRKILGRRGENALWSRLSHLLWSGAYSAWTATDAKTPLKKLNSDEVWKYAYSLTVSLPTQWWYLQLSPAVQIRRVVTKCKVTVFFNVNLKASKPLGSAGSLSSATTKFRDSYCALHKHANSEVQKPNDDCVFHCRQSS